MYLNAKFLANAVHMLSQLQLGTLEAHNSMISSKASVISAKDSKESGSRSGGDIAKLRSVEAANRSLPVLAADLKAVVAAD